MCSIVDFSPSLEKIVKSGISNSLGKGIIFSIHSAYGFRYTSLFSDLSCTLKCLLMVSTIIFGSILACWLVGCTGAATWQAYCCGARINRNAVVDYPVVEHSAVGKQTINYSADSSVAESSANAPIVENSTIGQHTTNYSGNSSAAVPSAKTREAESSAAK